MAKFDAQKRKLYRWERAVIAPYDGTGDVAFENIQSIVDYVWEELGKEYPPKVVRIQRNADCWARASRMELQVPNRYAGIPTWVILHELAHCLTSNSDGESHHHGARFLGVYMMLAKRFLGADEEVMFQTALAGELEFNFLGDCLG